VRPRSMKALIAAALASSIFLIECDMGPTADVRGLLGSLRSIRASACARRAFERFSIS
jgi:hypothetical protein